MESKIFMEIAQLVSRKIGVQLGEKQKVLVRSRLKRRIRDLKLNTALEYKAYLDTNFDSEFKVLVSILTTHHTFFFREFIHFEFLKENLKRIVTNVKSSGRNTIDIWCAASSYGQEVYSLAIFLKVHLPAIAPGMKFRVFGSDVDEKSVEFSKRGVYKWTEVKEIPNLYLTGNFARGTGQIKDFVKVKNEIRELCEFDTINLLDFPKKLGTRTFDLIFCRNVFIYFNMNQIRTITEQMMSHLYKYGYLIVGLSESLIETKLDITHYGQAVYGHKLNIPEKGISNPGVRPVLSNPSRPSTLTPQPIHTGMAQPIRVLAVDDSPTVLTLLKRILMKDHGFEVVGVAKNGIEAHDISKSLEFDVMTLDIHMPEMTGVEYLEAHNNANHPPVVVVSSVSRENADLALRCLKAGAADYVEKPSLANLEEKSDEIRNKIRVAHNSGKLQKTKPDEVQSQFSLSPIILECKKKLRIITGSVSELGKFSEILNQLKAPQPPTVVVIENLNELDTSVTDQLSEQVSATVKMYPGNQEELTPHRIYVADGKELSNIISSHKEKDLVTLALSNTGSNTIKSFSQLKRIGLVIGEDIGAYISPDHKSMCAQADYCVPATSFAYESEKHFTKERESAA